MNPNTHSPDEFEQELTSLVAASEGYSSHPGRNRSAGLEQGESDEPRKNSGTKRLPFLRLEAQNPIFPTKTAYTRNFEFLPFSKGSKYSKITAGRAKTSLWSYLQSWKWEIIWLLFSFAAFVGLIILLKAFDGKPLSSFHSKVISLNALVSAIAVVILGGLFHALSAAYGQHKWIWYSNPGEFRGFDTLDGASRGPSGSIKLLWWTFWSWMIELGQPSRKHGRFIILWPAILTIIGKGIDPFLQSVISYVGQNAAMVSLGGMPPVIGRAERVDLGTLLPTDGTFSAGIDGDGDIVLAGVIPDLGISSAILKGFDMPTTQNATITVAYPSLGFSCSTGNCTWPVYTTAAVCSACNDVSANIVKIDGNTRDPTDFSPPSDVVFNYTRTWTSYNLSYSHIRSFNYEPSENSTFGNTTEFAPLITANVSFKSSETITFQKMNTLLASFLMMRANPDFIANKTNWQNALPIATECALYLCTNAYETFVRNGKVNDTEKASFSNRVEGSFRPADGPTPQFEAANPALPAISGVRMNDLQLTIPSAQALTIGQNVTTVFNVTQTTIASIQGFIRSWGFEDDSSAVIVYPMGAGSGEAGHSYGILFTFNPLPEALWRSSNLTTTFQNLARLLTNRFRDASEITQAGTLQEYVIKIEIAYRFLIYPGVILVLGTVYIFFIILRTWYLELPVWKGSLFPVLAYGFDQEGQQYLRDIDPGRVRKSRRDSVKALKGRPMLLDNEGDHYRLKFV